MQDHPSTTVGQLDCAEELRDRLRHALLYVEETRRALVTALNLLERYEHEREEEAH